MLDVKVSFRGTPHHAKETTGVMLWAGTSVQVSFLNTAFLCDTGTAV